MIFSLCKTSAYWINIPPPCLLCLCSQTKNFWLLHFQLSKIFSQLVTGGVSHVNGMLTVQSPCLQIFPLKLLDLCGKQFLLPHIAIDPLVFVDEDILQCRKPPLFLFPCILHLREVEEELTTCRLLQSLLLHSQLISARSGIGRDWSQTSHFPLSSSAGCMCQLTPHLFCISNPAHTLMQPLLVFAISRTPLGSTRGRMWSYQILTVSISYILLTVNPSRDLQNQQGLYRNHPRISGVSSLLCVSAHVQNHHPYNKKDFFAFFLPKGCHFQGLWEQQAGLYLAPGSGAGMDCQTPSLEIK